MVGLTTDVLSKIASSSPETGYPQYIYVLSSWAFSIWTTSMQFKAIFIRLKPFSRWVLLCPVSEPLAPCCLLTDTFHFVEGCGLAGGVENSSSSDDSRSSIFVKVTTALIVGTAGIASLTGKVPSISFVVSELS